MPHDPARAVLQAARRAARTTDAPLVLAVSGGLDSMTLLSAMAEVARARIAAVATFDHGTGAAAAQAVAHVERAAAALGLPVIVGRSPGAATPPREARWREERHAFLRDVAMRRGAHVVTAHTEDDQVETVLMRLLRGSGTRGLAALLAPSAIVRPFLTLRRATLERFARARRLAWVDDPSNESRSHLRNRVRHDLLPALRAADPSIDDMLLATARAAAAWRADVERFVDARVRPQPHAEGGVSVAAAELAGYDRDSLMILWGALAGRAGLALDRRGTARLAEFTMKVRRSGEMPLSGGWTVEALPGRWLLRRATRAAEPRPLPGDVVTSWGEFRFVPVERSDPANPWVAALPADSGVTVRAWDAGDRLGPSGSQPRRRVARYLSDVGMHGTDRSRWPVVVQGNEVLWIPGVRRSDAATVRSGRPVRHYVCERIHSAR